MKGRGEINLLEFLFHSIQRQSQFVIIGGIFQWSWMTSNINYSTIMISP